jgi:hypothetical protein
VSVTGGQARGGKNPKFQNSKSKKNSKLQNLKFQRVSVRTNGIGDSCRGAERLFGHALEFRHS